MSVSKVWGIYGHRRTGKTLHAIDLIEKALPPDVVIVVFASSSSERKLWKTVRKPCIVTCPNLATIRWVLQNEKTSISIVFDEFSLKVFDSLTLHIASFLTRAKFAKPHYQPTMTVIVKHIATAPVAFRSYIDSWTLCGKKLPEPRWMQRIPVFDQYHIDPSKPVMNSVSKGLFISGVVDQDMVLQLEHRSLSTSLLKDTIVQYHAAVAVQGGNESKDNASEDSGSETDDEPLTKEVEPTRVLAELSLLDNVATAAFETCKHSHENLVFQCTTCHAMSVLVRSALCVPQVMCCHCAAVNAGHIGACITCSQPVYCNDEENEEKVPCA